MTPDHDTRALQDLQARERGIEAFLAYVAEHLHVQFAVRLITTVEELTALARRHRVPIDHLDVALFYRRFDQPFWPWYRQPMRVRRHFAHLGRLPRST